MKPSLLRRAWALVRTCEHSALCFVNSGDVAVALLALRHAAARTDDSREAGIASAFARLGKALGAQGAYFAASLSAAHPLSEMPPVLPLERAFVGSLEALALARIYQQRQERRGAR